jgi:hypothetical protein
MLLPVDLDIIRANLEDLKIALAAPQTDTPNWNWQPGAQTTSEPSSRDIALTWWHVWLHLLLQSVVCLDIRAFRDDIVFYSMEDENNVVMVWHEQSNMAMVAPTQIGLVTACIGVELLVQVPDGFRCGFLLRIQWSQWIICHGEPSREGCGAHGGSERRIGACVADWRKLVLVADG